MKCSQSTPFKGYMCFLKGLLVLHNNIWPCVYVITEDFSEAFSDQCMSELMGSGVGDQKKERCSMSLTCLDSMLKGGMKGYGLTHQLLYTILAEQVSGRG